VAILASAYGSSVWVPSAVSVNALFAQAYADLLGSGSNTEVEQVLHDLRISELAKAKLKRYNSNAPLLGSTAAEGLPRIGRTSIATRWRSCGLPQSASCSENFVVPPDVFGQTLIYGIAIVCATFKRARKGPRGIHFVSFFAAYST
jgi:hypothetical protein